MTQTNKEIFYSRSNGKLLLTGEYLVLKGAKALALPTKVGQELIVEGTNNHLLFWRTTVINEEWFNATFSIDGLNVLESNNSEIAETLRSILQEAQNLNPSFLKQGCKVKTNIEFNRDWGLGSSSTLVYNIAQWANCDAYEINKRVFKGSGYDIACAGAESPILFKKKKKVKVLTVDFNPLFQGHLVFVWLNRKQDTRKGISLLNEDQKFKNEVKALNAITEQLVSETSFDQFCGLLRNHEKIISEVINLKTVQSDLFSDFNGVVKSLGAWGGDFVLVASKLPFNELQRYFSEKGYKTVLKYSDLIN